MFKPAPMVRVSAVVLERDERKVLQALGHLGVIQLTRAEVDAVMASLVTRDCGVELAQCRHIIARVQELRRSLELQSVSTPTVPPVEWSPAQAEEQISAMEKAAGDLLKKRLRLVERLTELQSVDERLTDYRGLELPLDQPDESSFLHFVTGSLPLENYRKLQNEISGNIALLPLPERDGRQPLIVMTTRRGRSALEQVLQQAGFVREKLPAIHGATVDTLSEDGRREWRQTGLELEELNAEIKAFAIKCAVPLAGIETGAENECRLLEAGRNFSRTASAVLLAGWVPRAESARLEKRLGEITGGRCVVEILVPQDSTGGTVPVLLHHPHWLRPFEMLVTAYGLPHYRELEPTLFVAISYVLMFGVMFGDVGHGMLLALGGLAAMWGSRKAKVRDMGLLLLFAGISSVLFGFLYGSFFGLPSFKHLALWHDPLEGDPMSLMIGAICIGIGMISLGLVLNVINRWRHGDFLGSLLGKFGLAGVFFYWGSLLLLAKYAALESRGLVVPAVIIFLALPMAGWAIKEPAEFLSRRRAGQAIEPGGGLLASFSESLVGAFEAMLSYLANTISFVRLAAYAMSHAALLLAAFMMADAVKHLPAAGTFLSVAIIILGNIVAIVLEGVIASVQALRLEYYEFFGKFFAGGGQPFKPFRLQTTTTVANTPL